MAEGASSGKARESHRGRLAKIVAVFAVVLAACAAGTATIGEYVESRMTGGLDYGCEDHLALDAETYLRYLDMECSVVAGEASREDESYFLGHFLSFPAAIQREALEAGNEELVEEIVRRYGRRAAYEAAESADGTTPEDEMLDRLYSSYGAERVDAYLEEKEASYDAESALSRLRVLLGLPQLRARLPQ